ncbi:MAG: flagellar type III secretion system protein FliQ [Planctomycetes bacterium]|nr:flagellar type III secretion system protein FliQ [Planctomycetota bacterium]
MDQNALLDLGKTTLMTALAIVTPALIVGMTVGLLVSFFQTITSLQEQTLTIVPKMLAVVATLLLLMPWILGTLKEFTVSLFENLAAYGKAG